MTCTSCNVRHCVMVFFPIRTQCRTYVEISLVVQVKTALNKLAHSNIEPKQIHVR